MKKFILALLILFVFTQSSLAQKINAAWPVVEKRFNNGDYTKLKESLLDHCRRPTHNAYLPLGIVLLKGLGTEPDAEAAVSWLRRAANYKIYGTEPQLWLAYCYEYGLGVERDEKAARDYLSRACGSSRKMGMLNFLFHLRSHPGEIHEESFVVFEITKDLADYGEISAMVNLGVAYETGRGTNKDLARAREMYKKASASGSEMGQLNLARCYLSGTDTERDLNAAMQLYEQCFLEHKGVAAAFIPRVLDQLEDLNKVMTADPAATWQGLTPEMEREAYLHLGEYYLHYSPSDNPQKAIEYFKKATELKCAESNYYLGLLYQEGIGTGKNLKLAEKHFKAAASLGHAQASEKIKALAAK